MVQSTSSATSPSDYRSPRLDTVDNNSSHDASGFRVSGSMGKFADEPSFYGAVTDQLHAEQKSTIEALSGQVTFYRQREERYKKEVETLRSYVARQSASSSNNNSNSTTSGTATDADAAAKAHAFAVLADENRALGEEVDAWRSRARAYEQEKQRAEGLRLDAESQLRDAKLSLAGLSQAIEQLELKMQRKEAEVTTRCLELEQQLRAKTRECERLVDESTAAQLALQQLQPASVENQRLRSELLTLTQSSAALTAAAEAATVRTQSLEARRDELERAMAELQQQLAAARLDASAKQSRASELERQIESATSALALREQLLASEDQSRKSGESQRQELLALVTTLQTEKQALQSDTAAQRDELEAVRTQLQAATSRLSATTHGVMVSTLRSEMAPLKERMRTEFKRETDELRSEKAALVDETVALAAQVADKERFVQRLQRELLDRDETIKQQSVEAARHRERVSALELELASARAQYEQLQNCRAAIADKLDVGFKELLVDEDSAAAARAELATLQREVAQLRQRSETLDTQRQRAVDELARVRDASSEAQAQLNARIDELCDALHAKDATIAGLRRLEQQVATGERDVEAAARTADALRDRVHTLEQERTSFRAEAERLQLELRVREEQVQASVGEVEQREVALATGRQETRRLQETIVRLEERVQEAADAAANAREERSSREKKLLRERKQMAAEMAQLFARIDAVGKRNVELGDKVVALANQSKADQTDLVAMSSQLKAYRHRIRHLEGQLSRATQSSVRDGASTQDLVQQLREAEVLAERHEAEAAASRQRVEQLRSERDVVQKQHDEAAKRVRLLLQCQEQMKATVEGHTAELVEEIETTQDQLEAERKRCTVLLANEKALLRDLNERNAAISKLQRAVQSLQLQQQQQQRQHRHHSKNASETTRSSVSASDQAAAASTPTLSPREAASSSPPRPKQQQQSPQQRSTASPYSASAKELEHILSNLEQISTFSAQQQLQYQ